MENGYGFRELAGDKLEIPPADVLIIRLASSVDEAALLYICSEHGDILNVGILASGKTKQAVITYASAKQAASAVSGINKILHTVGPHRATLFNTDGMSSTCKAAASPSEVVHIQQFPMNWNEQDLQQMFSNFGSVVECCIHQDLPEYGTTEALVRMNSVASASRAIFALDAQIVKDTLGAATLMHAHFFQGFTTGSEASSEHVINFDNGLRQSQAPDLQKLDSSNMHHSLGNSTTSSDALAKTDLALSRQKIVGRRSSLPPGSLPAPADMNYWEAEAAQLRNSGSRVSSRTNIDSQNLGANNAAPHTASKSIYVSNLPPEADMLWVYERFAPYGGVLSVKVLQEQRSGKCSGVCFVNYMEPRGAASAIQSLDGIRIAGRSLQVKLQDNRR